MQIRKEYQGLQPELLYYEIKDFFVHQQQLKITVDRLETFSTPANSATTIFQGTLVFETTAQPGKKSVKVRLQGTEAESKVAIDIDDDALSEKQISAFQDDIDFFMGSYEAKTE